MAKEIVIKNSISGSNFKNITSETIFSFGKFSVTSNFDNKRSIDHTNKLSSFVAPISLNTLGVTKQQSDLIYASTNEIKLNLEKSDLNKYIRFGSAYDYFRFAIQNIITSFPGSLYINSHMIRTGNITYYDFVYDSYSNTSTFKIPSSYIDNKFNLVYNSDYTTLYGTNELNNINLSFEKYVIWSTFNPNNAYKLNSFVGYNNSTSYIVVTVEGNPFPFTNNSVSGAFDFHIKPSTSIFEEFRLGLKDYERYMLSERIDKGFKFIIKNPSVNDEGDIEYINSELVWPTLDGYNIDFGNVGYQQFLEALLNIGNKFDVIKTDLIARFLTTSSLKAYDLTGNGKITKLLRIYGYEFDQLRIFIDSLQYVNSISYDKKDNVPDAFVANLANTFGWEYFPVTTENDLMSNLLSTDGVERNLSTDLLPLEIDIEVWRRILINTNYYWKSKGTRDAIKSIFMLIGIPEQFINITEYIYTVDGKINPAEDVLTTIDYPTNSFPYDVNGYPQAPLETNSFYFQVSGNTDSGQDYMNIFRKAGFDLYQTIDNKKSWVQSGATARVSDLSPTYYQNDSKLVLNTKEIDIGLDIAQAIELDTFDHAKANNIFLGIENASNLSFFQFIDIAQKKLINAKDRKTITDGRGGWYPTLLKVYLDYLKCDSLSDSDPMHSNGYTCENLYPFLNKYNAFFNRFVNTLLSPTIILRKSGIVIRNTMFTKQKFTYKRGVYMGKINFYGGVDNATDFAIDNNLMYLGDDGSVMKKIQAFQCNLSISVTSTDPSAYNTSDGSATVTVSGGRANYNYIWSNGQSTSGSSSNTNSITGLTGNTTYNLFVSDDNGCVISGSTYITQPSLLCNLSIIMSSTDPSAYDTSDGSATAIISGGTANYTYVWSNGQSTSGSSSNTNSITGLTGNTTYNLFVSDGNGCMISGSTYITQPTHLCDLSLSFTSTIPTNADNNDGTATVTISGGTANYEYNWSNGQSTSGSSSNTNTATGLSGGTMYSVMLADSVACVITGTTMVPEAIAVAYGYLYNYFALANIAPIGWHVPTDAEWYTLTQYIDPSATPVTIGGNNESLTAGGDLKEMGVIYWDSSNVGATNSVHFNARGGGHRRVDGVYEYMRGSNTYASSTTSGADSYWYRSLFSYNTIVYSNHSYKNYGYSVRLVKDDSIDTGNVIVDGIAYPTVTIGTQVWMAKDLRATKDKDGVDIQFLPNDVDWSTDTLGAYCTYVL